MNCYCGLSCVSSVLRRAIVSMVVVVLTTQALAVGRFEISPSGDVGAAIQREVERDWMDRDRQLSSSAAKEQSQQVKDGNFSFDHTRQVIQRANGLADRLRKNSHSKPLDVLSLELKHISAQLSKFEASEKSTVDDRQKIYLQARWLARRLPPLWSTLPCLYVAFDDCRRQRHRSP